MACLTDAQGGLQPTSAHPRHTQHRSSKTTAAPNVILRKGPALLIYYSICPPEFSRPGFSSRSTIPSCSIAQDASDDGGRGQLPLLAPPAPDRKTSEKEIGSVCVARTATARPHHNGHRGAVVPEPDARRPCGQGHTPPNRRGPPGRPRQTPALVSPRRQIVTVRSITYFSRCK